MIVINVSVCVEHVAYLVIRMKKENKYDPLYIELDGLSFALLGIGMGQKDFIDYLVLVVTLLYFMYRILTGVAIFKIFWCCRRVRIFYIYSFFAGGAFYLFSLFLSDFIISMIALLYMYFYWSVYLAHNSNISVEIRECSEMLKAESGSGHPRKRGQHP